MPTQETDIAEQTATVLDHLAHPDPDPDVLPMLKEPDGLALQEQTAGHLVRAIMRQGDTVENLKKAMGRDMQAWGEVIARAESKVTNWRMIVRDWMLRNDVTKLQSPWFTASIGKSRSKIVVDDEGPCIEILETKFKAAAVKLIKKIDKKEFDVIWNSVPSAFEKVAHEETGEPTLLIRRKEA